MIYGIKNSRKKEKTTTAKATKRFAAKVAAPTSAPSQFSIYDLNEDCEVIEPKAKSRRKVPAAAAKKNFQTVLQRAVIVSDGSALGQYGPAGWSAIVTIGEATNEYSGRIKGATSNAAELRGAVEGLARVPAGMGAKLLTDSKYLLDGVYRNRLPAKAKSGDAKLANRELWLRLADLMADRIVEIEWIKGHNGHEGNERADALAKAAAREEQADQQREAARETREKLEAARSGAPRQLFVGQMFDLPYVASEAELRRVFDHEYAPELVEDAAIVRHVWPDAIRKKVVWFLRAYATGGLPGEAFKIARGVTVGDAGIFYARLRAALATGPNSVGEITLENLQRLYNLYSHVGRVGPEIKTQLQVIHKGTPKLVCLVFNVGGKPVAFHEATATQTYGASPGGVDKAALLWLRRAGVGVWYHWTKPEGPLFTANVATILEEGELIIADDRVRHFLPITGWKIEDELPFKSPWIPAKNAVVLDPITYEAVNLK